MKGYDLTNQIFGHLTVIELDKQLTKEKGKKYWKCQCDCGNIKSIRQDNLISKKSSSCGCSNQIKIGQQFGFLITIERDYNYEKTHKTNNACWKCRCVKCGNITTVRSADLKNGHTKSCGCLNAELSGQRNLKDLFGQKFGHLTVINKILSDSNGHSKWKCKCDCGNIVEVLGTNLIRQHTTSCGCDYSSKGERKIKEFLDKYNISYKQQYHFDDLINIQPLRFDFAIFNNNQLLFLIEYQGEQHYKIVEHWGGEQGLKERQYNDKLKQDYCKQNNINLIEITYKQLINIDNILSNILL